MIEELNKDIIETISTVIHVDIETNKISHSKDMFVRLATKEWIHPSLVTPKSVSFHIGLDQACNKFVEKVMYNKKGKIGKLMVTRERQES